MARWTKVGAIARMQKNARLQEILALEPELLGVLDAAVRQRRNGNYSRIQTYVALRNQVIPWVGWHARVRELQNVRDYQAVIDTLMDLLPPDEGDLWPDGRPEVRD